MNEVDDKIRSLREELKREIEKEIRRMEESLMKDIKLHFYILLILYAVLALRVLSLVVK